MDKKLTDKEKCLISIPNNANHVEILGHKIDDFESFEAFCEHLKKYSELEETVNRLQAENERLQNNKPRLIAQIVIDDDKMENVKNACLERIEYNIRELKAEAYKECIEKVNERIAVTTFTNKSEEYSNGFYDAIAWVDGEIDKLEKELVGDDKCS